MTFSSRLRSTTNIFSVVVEIIFFSSDLSSMDFALCWEQFWTIDYFHSILTRKKKKKKGKGKWKSLTAFSSEFVFNVMIDVLEYTCEGLFWVISFNSSNRESVAGTLQIILL